MNTKIALGWLIIAPFFAGCSTTAQQVGSIAISKARQSATIAAPKGWVSYPAPEADSAALPCANYSQREWKVSLGYRQLEK
jgi:hypothetical protein